MNGLFYEKEINNQSLIILQYSTIKFCFTKCIMKFFWSSMLMMLIVSSMAQVDCPEGYEQKKVKCNDKINLACVPIGFTCKKCWNVEFAPCPGRQNGGSCYYNSYDKALEAAKKESNNWHDGKCTWYDNTKYSIYIDNQSFCGNSINDTATAINDLLHKVNPFLKRYLSEIKNFRRQYKGQPYKPRAIFKEYNALIDQAEENANNLEIQLNYITNTSLTEIEKAFHELQLEEQELKKATESLVSNPTNNSTSQKKLVDEEKLNQALMKKLEKDFDEEHNSKNNETVTTSKSSSSNNSTKIGNASRQNTSNYKISQTSTKKYTFFTWQNNNGSVFNLYLSKVVEFTDESWDSVWKSMQEKFNQYMKLRGIYFSVSDQVNHFPAVETREAATKLKQSTITKHTSLFGSNDSRSSLSFEIN